MARGIAFVSFTTVNALLQCVAMDGDLLGDRNVKVKRAEQRKKQAPRRAGEEGNGRAEQEGGGGGRRGREGDYWKEEAGGRDGCRR